MFNKGAPHRPKGRKPKAGNEKNKGMRKEVKNTDGSDKQTKTEPVGLSKIERKKLTAASLLWGWPPMQSAYFTFNGSNEYLEFPSCALLNNLEVCFYALTTWLTKYFGLKGVDADGLGVSPKTRRPTYF